MRRKRPHLRLSIPIIRVAVAPQLRLACRKEGTRLKPRIPSYPLDNTEVRRSPRTETTLRRTGCQACTSRVPQGVFSSFAGLMADCLYHARRMTRTHTFSRLIRLYDDVVSARRTAAP